MIRRALFGVVLLAALAGCGLSPQAVEQAEQLQARIEHRLAEVEDQRQALTRFLESEQSAGLRAAAEREQWAGRLQAAQEKIAAARQTYQQQIQPVIEADDSSREYDLYTYFDQIAGILDGSREDVEFWQQRREALLQAKTNAARLREQSRAFVQDIEKQLDALEQPALAAKREFPEQSEAIDRLIDPLEARAAGSREALEVVETQYAAHLKGGDPDYGLLQANAARISENREAVLQGANEAEAKLAELSQSYSRTLTDMKAEYILHLRRQSWDNNVDYPTLHTYDYPDRQVDAAMFEHINEIPGSLATFRRGWFGDDLDLHPRLDQARWEALRIDPEENWPSSDDDEAEIWLERTTVNYFHKYHVVQNGETSETDWVAVDEAFFFANIDNLGMDVVSKPYGVFESDKLTQAAPPGMAYVGNERYGRWERQNGGMVWTWIAPYLFYRSLFGNPWQYRRDEWNTWRSGYYGSRPYYGSSSSSTPVYGTRGSRTRSSPTLAGSQFGRSGGFNRPAGSVRGAGPAGRGGGFGGSGK